jgi:hypothetical protein
MLGGFKALETSLDTNFQAGLVDDEQAFNMRYRSLFFVNQNQFLSYLVNYLGESDMAEINFPSLSLKPGSKCLLNRSQTLR